MSIIHLGNEDFEQLVKEGVVIIDFYAEWCGPCKMLGPMLETFSSQRSDVKVIKIDIDQHEDMARAFGIMSVPTLMLYKNGAVVSTRQGFQTVDMLNEWVNN